MEKFIIQNFKNEQFFTNLKPPLHFTINVFATL